MCLDAFWTVIFHSCTVFVFYKTCLLYPLHRYGVVKTPGDMEMRPLESDDDDDEDITMFNRKD